MLLTCDQLLITLTVLEWVSRHLCSYLRSSVGRKNYWLVLVKVCRKFLCCPAYPIYINMVLCMLFAWGMEFKFLADPRGYFTRIRQGCHTGTKAEISLARCQWSYPKGHGHIGPELNHNKTCRLTFDISRALVGNKIVDYSDVVGVSPACAAPTISSISTLHLISMYCTKSTVRRADVSYITNLTVIMCEPCA